MTWFRVDDTFPQHVKLEELEGDAVEHALAIAAWTLIGADCAARRTDGRFTERRITRVLPWPAKLCDKARDALLRIGLWERDGDSLRFHDWEDYQPTKAELDADRKLATERQKRWREKRRQSRAVDASTNALGDASVTRAAHQGTDTVSAIVTVDALVTTPRPVPSRPVPSSPTTVGEGSADLLARKAAEAEKDAEAEATIAALQQQLAPSAPWEAARDLARRSRGSGRMKPGPWLACLRELEGYPPACVASAVAIYVDKAEGDDGEVKREAYLVGIARGEAKRPSGKSRSNGRLPAGTGDGWSDEDLPMSNGPQPKVVGYG
jgi:hypothetical protein